MRLFVAADLPGDVRARFASYGAALAASGGWRAVPEASLHLTLAFLGERPDEDVERIAAALPPAATIAVGPVTAGGALLLPRRSPRVAAVELSEPAGGLVALQASVATALEDLGVYAPDRRPWLAHVTVARRTRGPRGDAPAPAWPAAPFRVATVTLYRSRLHPHGARYEPLASTPVAGG